MQTTEPDIVTADPVELTAQTLAEEIFVRAELRAMQPVCVRSSLEIMQQWRTVSRANERF